MRGTGWKRESHLALRKGNITVATTNLKEVAKRSRGEGKEKKGWVVVMGEKGEKGRKTKKELLRLRGKRGSGR